MQAMYHVKNANHKKQVGLGGNGGYMRTSKTQIAIEHTKEQINNIKQQIEEVTDSKKTFVKTPTNGTSISATLASRSDRFLVVKERRAVCVCHRSF